MLWTIERVKQSCCTVSFCMPYKNIADKREHGRRYREEHREALAAYRRRWFKERYDSSPEFRRRSRVQQSADAGWAHSVVHRAIKRGELVRPTSCSACGCDGFIEAAHYNYSEPLRIRWLCRACHRKWDHAEPKGAATTEGASRDVIPKHWRRRIGPPAPRRSWQAPLVDFTCSLCGQPFQATAHDRRRSDTPCCSKRCSTTLSRAKRRQALQQAGIGIADCGWCGVRFEREPNRLRRVVVFCSKSCSQKYQWAQKRGA